MKQRTGIGTATCLTALYMLLPGSTLSLGELLRRDFEAYLAQGPTHPNWDVLVRLPRKGTDDSTDVGGDRLVTIEVKTIDWPRRNAVQVQKQMHFDFLVVVLLNKGCNRSRFLVFRNRDAELHLSPPNSSRPHRTMSIKATALCNGGALKHFEDQWDIIG